jgi:lysyl-tRNA synthetase class 2
VPDAGDAPRGLPHRFGNRTEIAFVRDAHGSLGAGEEADASYRLAGRVLGRRGMGKAVFLDLEDRSGRIQLLGSVDVLGQEAFDGLRDLNLGDVIGVEGHPLRSRRGELSLRVQAWELLAPCLRPMPDLHHGLADVERRYRQRYLDLMVNRDVRRVFEARARIVTAMRRVLDADGFIEVETPVLQPIYGGARARPFTTHHNELDRTLYLRIADELYLKRLIVGGLERVYEIGKDFRNEGVSFKHNPEFTMLEWYEAYADYTDGMERSERLVAACAVAATGSTVIEDGAGGTVDVAPPWPRIPLFDAIERASGIDARAERDPARLRQLLLDRGVEGAAHDTTWPQLVDRLLSHYVEPASREPMFLVDYPVELSPLSRPREDDPSLVERFEAFCAGMEILNGYSELNDPELQRLRFEEQAADRQAGDEEAPPVDDDYVEALTYGMPPTLGVGIGVDRLTMLLVGTRSIRDVILFPALRT